ncbi:MAG: signal peptide peptidase SppA, partial [Alphaproteobacteria bacterium]|nr:signal peptide peptidase SppA [Alphaproteobacteria bacterium]
MAFDSDALIDRRRLKRRLAMWRLLALVSLLAVAAVAFARVPTLPGSKHIAVLWVDDIIFADPYRDAAIEALADDPSVAAVLVHIDSPGGTTFGSEALYRGLLRVGEAKPVVAVMNQVAASGGYMTALAADFIVARESTITGSIGVVLEATNFVGLMEKLGIENDSITSAPLKAQPNPLSRLSPEARAATREVIDDIHAMFVAMVAERRDMTALEAVRLADGRIYTGAMAKENGLLDAIGGEDVAIAWLEETHAIEADLPLIDVQIDYPDELLDRLVSASVGKSH